MFKQLSSIIRRRLRIGRFTVAQHNIFKLYQSGQYETAISQAKLALEEAKSIWLGDHPNVATSINNLGVFFQAQGKYIEAQQFFQEALAMRQRLFENDHPMIATSLNNLGALLQEQGKLSEAESYYRDALTITRKLFKGNNLNIATSLNNLGALLQEQGKVSEAESYYRDALAITRKLFKDNNLDIAYSLNNLGGLMEAQGRLAEAESYYRDGLAMLQRLFENDHPLTATSLNNLGALLKVQGKLSEAETLFMQALTMRQKLFKDEHPDLAQSLNNLGNLLEVQGRYREAESYYRNDLAILQKLFQDNHPLIAGSFNNLATSLIAQGRYTEAEPYFRDALKIRQRLFKDDHPDVAQSLDNLAVLLKRQGRYTEAESYYHDALAMLQRLFKDDHPDVAQSLDNLAASLQAQRKYKEAESYHHDALTMLQRLFDGDHPLVARILNNLAASLQAQGKYKKAESYYHDALTITQKLFKGDHLDIAIVINNFGYLSEVQEKYAEAELYYRNSLEMKQRLFKDDHPSVASSLTILGALLQVQENYTEALVKFQKAVAVENNLINAIFAFSSEADRLRHLASIKSTIDILLSLVSNHFPRNRQAIQKAFDVILQRKSLSAAAIAAFNSVIYEERYQHLQEQLQKWRSLGEQIFHLTFNQNKPEDHERLEKLKQKANRLEKDLASQVSEIQLKGLTINHQTLAEELPSGSVLLEFVHFSVSDFNNKRWDSPRYLVFILSAGQPDKVEMKILGEAKEIEELIELSRLLNITYQSSADGQLVRFDGKELVIDPSKFSQIPTQVKPESIPHYQYVTDAAIKLRQKIFDPIAEYLQDCQQIFISPDASLNLVPFGILPLDETGEELLGDRYQISYLSAGRDLFRSTVSTNRSASAPLVIADPKFLLDESDSVAISQTKETETPSTPTTLGSELIKVLDEEHLSRAETTGLLATKVAAMLGVEPHLQADALVTHLKSDRCPRILLIGTHGLYCPLSEAQQNAIAHQERDRLSSLPQTTNPMIRSGLAFAGATNWQKNLPLPPEAGNGYLMAQDVAQLDLWANEITVLLACNSAVGDIHQGEGVFGLRRAFAVAGAKTLIMSLWSVPEKASALLMERFFNNLKQKMGRNAALQEAQNYIRFITVEELRQSDLGLEVLKELTGNRNFASETLVEDESCQPLKHPFYWGAWICQGETTPFDI